MLKWCCNAAHLPRITRYTLRNHVYPRKAGTIPYGVERRVQGMARLYSKTGKANAAATSRHSCCNYFQSEVRISPATRTPATRDAFDSRSIHAHHAPPHPISLISSDLPTQFPEKAIRLTDSHPPRGIGPKRQVSRK